MEKQLQILGKFFFILWGAVLSLVGFLLVLVLGYQVLNQNATYESAVLLLFAAGVFTFSGFAAVASAHDLFKSRRR